MKARAKRATAKKKAALETDADGKTKRGRLRVRATDVGYYEHIRRRIGDVFVIVGAIVTLLAGVLNSWIEPPGSKM